jgi:hypothetical protein
MFTSCATLSPSLLQKKNKPKILHQFSNFNQTIKPYTMSKPFQMKRYRAMLLLAPVLSLLLLLGSCNKQEDLIKHGYQPFSYPSEVLDKWMTMQLRLMKNATGIPNHGFSRHFTYAGIAAVESLRPGLTGQVKQLTVWNGLSGLPETEPTNAYYYPANVNAALAAINKSMFPNASVADKFAIDSLEAALNAEFLVSNPQSIITVSNQFGKAVATAVYSWSETDGYKNANNTYTVPVGPGLWKPTPPAMAAPATPYWGNNRNVIPGSTDNAYLPAPLAYSTEQGTPFYQMVKQVYDASQTLTDDQKNMALFWRDVPGITSPGHWLSILQQVIRQEGTSLDKAALAYALTGAAINDALIVCFKSKYQFNLVRPITYIREVMGHTTWNSFLGTPAHPEYGSAHSSLSSAAAEVMQKLFGDIGSFTDHSYDYLNYPARTYPNLRAIGLEAGQSRLYAGIHYQQSIDAGTQQGIKVANNIFNKSNPQ